MHSNVRDYGQQVSSCMRSDWSGLEAALIGNLHRRSLPANVQGSSSNALFERVVHYDSPQPSPAIAARRMRFRSSVAPSPPTSNRSESTERLQQHGKGGSDDAGEMASVTSLAAVALTRPTSTKKIREVRARARCEYQDYYL